MSLQGVSHMQTTVLVLEPRLLISDTLELSSSSLVYLVHSLWWILFLGSLQYTVLGPVLRFLLYLPFLR